MTTRPTGDWKLTTRLGIGSCLAGMATVALLLAGCTAADVAESGPSVLGSSSLTPAEGATAPQSATRAGAGLRAEFLAWVYPVDRSDVLLGRRVYESFAGRQQDKAMGSCLVSRGFRELGEEILSAPANPVESEMLLYPDVDRLRVDGFLVTSGGDRSAASLAEGMSLVDIEDREQMDLATDWARERSAEHPDWRLTEAEFAPFIVAAVECMHEHVQERTFASDPAFATVMTMQNTWSTSLREIDRLPVVADKIEGALICLRQVGPEFADAGDLQEWFAIQFGSQIAMDFAAVDPASSVTTEDFFNALREWGQQYGECMAGVVEARVPLRAIARASLVDDDLPVLLELQLRFDELLQQTETEPSGS